MTKKKTNARPVWTSAEKQIVRDFYGSAPAAADLMKMLPRRPARAIQTMASHLKIPRCVIVKGRPPAQRNQTLATLRQLGVEGGTALQVSALMPGILKGGIELALRQLQTTGLAYKGAGKAKSCFYAADVDPIAADRFWNEKHALMVAQASARAEAQRAIDKAARAAKPKSKKAAGDVRPGASQLRLNGTSVARKPTLRTPANTPGEPIITAQTKITIYERPVAAPIPGGFASLRPGQYAFAPVSCAAGAL